MASLRSPAYDVAIYAPTCAQMYLDAPAVGGAERQLMILARSLAAAGLRVCHIVEAAGDLPASRDGVTIIPEAPPAPGESAWGRIRRVVAALRKADAHVYIQRSSGLSTLFVGAFARWRGRIFIYSVSSPQGLTGRHDLSVKEWIGFTLGLPCAHAVVVQTSEQAAWAARCRNVVHIPSFSVVPSPSNAQRDVFLWVGRPASYKGPMAFADLASGLPEARFLMVGVDLSSPDVSSELISAVSALENLTVLPPLPQDQLWPLYRRAVAVVNTSDFEGFPNSFLEGWAHGALALSLRVDPDSLIAGHGMGFVANGSAADLTRVAREMWRERNEPDSQRSVACRYARENHAPDAVVRRWLALLQQLEPRVKSKAPGHAEQGADSVAISGTAIRGQR